MGTAEGTRLGFRSVWMGGERKSLRRGRRFNRGHVLLMWGWAGPVLYSWAGSFAFLGRFMSIRPIFQHYSKPTK